jgi:hypothetical protein
MSGAGDLAGVTADSAADDLEQRRQSDRIGRRPAGRGHRADDILLRPFEAVVDDVAGNALGGDGSGSKVGQAGLMLIMAPGERGGEIGENEIGRHESGGDNSDATIELFCRHRRDSGGPLA